MKDERPRLEAEAPWEVRDKNILRAARPRSKSPMPPAPLRSEKSWRWDCGRTW